MFGSRLRAARKAKKLTQGELGTFLRVGKSTICNWENETSRPDNVNLVKLADILHVSADYLLGRTDGPELLKRYNIGENVKNVRASLGLSIDAFANKLGVSHQHVIEIESNQRKPSHSDLKLLAQLSGKQVDTILGLQKGITLMGETLGREDQELIREITNQLIAINDKTDKERLMNMLKTIVHNFKQ